MSAPKGSDRKSRAVEPHPRVVEAVALHQAGRLSDAAKLYQQIIDENPGNFDASHLLGVVALQEGDFVRAEDLIIAALRIKSDDSSALTNLGTVYLRTRQYERAYDACKRAVELQPRSAGALANLGTVLRLLGRPREALVYLARAYSQEGKNAVICNLMGACTLDTGDARQAVRFFEEATTADPASVDGWSNLAVALNNLGEHERARSCVDTAISLQPDSPAAMTSLATVQFEQGDVEEAIASYRKAMALPDSSAQTHCAFANALWTTGRCNESFEQLSLALTVDGHFAIARWKLAMSQCQPYYDSADEIERSRRVFADHMAGLTAWFRAEARPEAHSAVGSSQPFYLAYQPFENKELLSRYGDLCHEWMTTASFAVPDARRSESGMRAVPRPESRVLKVGLVSAHVKNHSVWNAISRGLVEHFDKASVQVSVFHLGRTSDAETARVRSTVANFVDRPEHLQSCVRQITEAKLDVLIYPEIGMDAWTTQLASLRLAPVQAAMWGHPETTGLPTMDLYISADAFEPVGSQIHYRERLISLPNLGTCVDPLRPPITVPDWRALGLPNDVPLLLCPGTPAKYSPVHDHVWAKIAKGLRVGAVKRGWRGLVGRLGARGDGRLVFFRSGTEHLDQLLAQRLRRAFDVEQLDFDLHVSFIPFLDRPRFFGLMQHATIMLDTLQFSGFNTALQAVEAGLPVVAREGRFMRGRLASGIMRRMDMPELVAGTDEEYIETAIRLVHDSTEHAALRRKLIDRRSLVFGDLTPVRALEHCLIEAVARAGVEGPR